MQRFFYPESIVVIGVSEKPDNLARNIIGNLVAFDYQGELYAVGDVSALLGMPVMAAFLENRGEWLQEVAVDNMLRFSSTRALSEALALTGLDIGDLGAELMVRAGWHRTTG